MQIICYPYQTFVKFCVAFGCDNIFFLLSERSILFQFKGKNVNSFEQSCFFEMEVLGDSKKSWIVGPRIVMIPDPLKQRFPTTGTGPGTGTWRRSKRDQKSCQSGIFHSTLMPHGTKIAHKTGRRDLRPKRLGTTALKHGWPHFLFGGHKSAPQKIGGTKICSKRLGGQYLTL